MKLYTLNLNDKEALYIQLYKNIKADILNKKLKPNEVLPSKRELASHLNISINTVINAYNLLLEEGFITSIPKKGYYVLNYNIKINKQTKETKSENKTIDYKYDLSTKKIDNSLFPIYTWNKISKQIIYNSDFLNKSNNLGNDLLRDTISSYLYETKGINVDKNNIIIGSGIEYLLTNLINILNINTYAIEDPGYDKINKILLNNHKNVIYAPLDDSGIKVESLNGALCVYTTPANQFPTGIKMSLERKLELIKWAYDKYIIEDDFDSEFKYLSNTSTSIYALSPNNTIMLSTYSRTITPSLRIAYMILPDSLLDKYNKTYSFYSSTVSTLDQLILNEFIKSGAYSRHLNKTKDIYKKKRKLIISILQNYDFIKIDYKNSYLSLIIEVDNLDKQKFMELIKYEKIDISIMDDYIFKSKPTNKIIIGYTSINIENIPDVINLVISIIKTSLI